MPKLDDGDLGHPQLASREQSGVPREYIVVGTHQDRVGPSELLHRRRHLRDLLGAVRAGIGDARNQPTDGPSFHLDIDSDLHGLPCLLPAAVERRRPIVPNVP